MKRHLRSALLALLVAAASPLPALAQLGSAQDQAFRQQAVDSILANIKSTIGTSLQTLDWRDRYRQASRSIEDLRKALQVGGKITYDPIAPFHSELEALWAERHEYWTFLHGSIIRAQKLSKRASQQAARDVGGTMIRFLMSPKPGLGTLANAARTKDAEVIKRDFADIKTAEQAIKTIRGYIENMKPAMLELKERRAELAPVRAAFKALMGGVTAGAYVGKVSWDQTTSQRTLDGFLRFTITGDTLKGDFEIRDGRDGDPLRVERKGEIFNGHVFPDGRIEAEIKGAGRCIGKCDELAGILVKALLAFPFRGKLEGRLAGQEAAGKFDVHSTDKREKVVTANGRWKATRDNR